MSSKHDRKLNDHALGSLVQRASESATYDIQTGVISYPFHIYQEVEELPVLQRLQLESHVKQTARKFADARFDRTLELMGFTEQEGGRIVFPQEDKPLAEHPAAPEWAKRRASEEKTNRLFETTGWIIFCVFFLCAGIMFAIHKNGQQIRFDRQASIDASTR